MNSRATEESRPKREIDKIEERRRESREQVRHSWSIVISVAGVVATIIVVIHSNMQKKETPNAEVFQQELRLSENAGPLRLEPDFLIQ